MGDISAEPSMEDILSSIKRIIAEEGESAATIRARRAMAGTAMSKAGPGSFGHDEILELSDPVRFAAAGAPRADGESAPAAASTASPQKASAAPGAPADPILSYRAAEASRGSLDALSRVIVKPDVQGSDTLESLVREMLRPMLRDWLDANLPAMVETLVSREIARITGAR